MPIDSKYIHFHVEREPLPIDHSNDPGEQLPLDELHAVIDDFAEAERAVEELLDSGFLDDEVDLLEVPSLADLPEEQRGRSDVARRLITAFEQEEQTLTRRYALEAAQGHAILLVHAPQRAVVERARQVLVAHGAHDMWFYGRTTLTRL